MTTETSLEKQIKLEEDLRLKAYKDSEGHLTIGWGHNLEAEPDFEGELIPHEITEELAQKLLRHGIQVATDDIEKRWPRFKELSPARRDACIQMAFQLGVSGFLEFEVLRAALMARDSRGAYNAALRSKWAMQTPARAKRIANQFLTGQYYFKK